MLLVIDNYDSFTYNLVQYLGELGATVEVRRNDRVTLDEIDPATMEKNDYFRTPGKAIGTGPFIVKAYSAGQSMELSRNDAYWRAKPHLDGIIRREFKDTTSALLAFEAGEVDYTYVTADEVERANGIPKSTVLPGPSGVDLDIVLNPLKNKDFADKRVRQAFLYAIDRKSILQNIYHIPDPVLLNCLYLDPTLNPPYVHTGLRLPKIL